MKPKIKATRAKLQLQLLSFCLLCLSGKTRCDGNGATVVTVKQNSDAVLPCSPNTKENIERYHFEWKKAAQKEVFYYDAGITYDSGLTGQSEEFKGRVSHSEEGLTQGNASIIIRNTAVSDSGSYTCDFPDLQPRQTFHIELVVEPAVITVKQDGDALLPCSLSTENIEQGYFYWYKLAQNNDKQKDVFQYEKGQHSPSFGHQDDGFKGRVSHFPQELKHGNASIIINNTKMDDNGNYTCVFPERQTFHIQLVVGTCPKPNLRILGPTKTGMLLECKVEGASPKPKVEWKDSSGKIVDAEEPQVTDRGGSYDIILQTTVTKTDNYSCVSTQEEICHQISADTHVPVNDHVLKDRTDENIPGAAVVTVKQNSDAVLPCSPNTKENIEAYHFEWKKAAQKEVFYYDAGITYDLGLTGQSEEFKGRVSHSQEGLTQGNASIIIRNTAVSDSGSYTCDFPDLQPRQTFHIELVVEPAVITVKQDEDALLPCSLSTENIEQGYFYWYKLAQNNETQKDVFQYEKGKHTPSFGSQDVGFKGRVSHFPQELKHGNASIIIRNTKTDDSGNYTCVFPKRQTFHIQLVVECDLKDRTRDKKPGTCPKPNLSILGPANNGMLLECVVQGASSELKVELKDSSGKILDAKPQAAGRGDIILRATVTKTDNYSCVCKQEKICHQISVYTYVPVNDSTGWVVTVAVLCILLVVVVAGALAFWCYQKKKQTTKDSQTARKDGSKVPLNGNDKSSESQKDSEPEAELSLHVL